MASQQKPLEIGKEYRDGNNCRVNIAGHTKNNKAWVYSLQGNWYEQATGKFLWYKSNGTYVTIDDVGRNIPTTGVLETTKGKAC